MIGFVLTLLPGLALGAVSVAQGGLNRQSAATVGLDAAVLLNNVILLAATLVTLLAIGRPAALGEAAALLRPDPAHLRYWVPGLLGLLLVAGIPFAVAKVGATRLFVPLVASQLLLSLAWDAWIEGLAPNWTRAVGALIALAGAGLAAF